jgi:hypothetical protein
MQDLINDAFKFLNAYKRHRTLHTEAKMKGNYGESQIQELKMYQTFDSLELVVRGIQRIEREKSFETVNVSSIYKKSTDSELSYNKNSIPIANSNLNQGKGQTTITKVGV